MKIWIPIFLDHMDREIKGKWLVRAETKHEAFERATSFFNDADVNTRPFLCPQKDCWKLVDITELEFSLKNHIAMPW